MRTNKIHKHIRINGRYVSVNFRNGRWETSVSWGLTARKAAIEYARSNTYRRDDEPKTIMELHEREI